MQVNCQKTTVKRKIAYFLKNYVASLFTIFEKVLAICNFFHCSVFRCKVLSPFTFYLFEVQWTVLLSLEAAIIFYLFEVQWTVLLSLEAAIHRCS